ncbi:MAG: hypothetical protein WCF20_05410 [Methylovirgula sp.]
MPIPAEKIAAGHCYRATDKALRKVLIRQGRRVTYIVRGELAWTVLRSYVDAEDFAAECEAEIDCTSLQDMTADAASA